MDTTKIDCVCCKLPARVRDVIGQDPAKVCDECAGHSGPNNTTAMALDHATAYWERMEDAERRADDAHRRADSALNSRDQAVRALGTIREDHWHGVEKCTCGREECRTGWTVSAEWVTTLLKAAEKRRGY